MAPSTASGFWLVAALSRYTSCRPLTCGGGAEHAAGESAELPAGQQDANCVAAASAPSSGIQQVQPACSASVELTSWCRMGNSARVAAPSSSAAAGRSACSGAGRRGMIRFQKPTAPRWQRRSAASGLRTGASLQAHPHTCTAARALLASRRQALRFGLTPLQGLLLHAAAAIASNFGSAPLGRRGGAQLGESG